MSTRKPMKFDETDELSLCVCVKRSTPTTEKGKETKCERFVPCECNVDQSSEWNSGEQSNCRIHSKRSGFPSIDGLITF